jgi:SPP1 gp7 family putative phage head morphogenesis protein
MSAADHHRLFLHRLEGLKAAALTHPWVQWVTVIDPGTAPACRALNGKRWKVDSSALAAVVREHLDAEHPNCRCRLTPKRKP